MNTFQQDISHLKESSIDAVLTAIENHETKTFFLGRGSCPYCRLFASKLANVVKKTGATVYFVNSENTNEKLQQFRQQHGIKTVPSYIQVQNGNFEFICDSSISEDKIKQFANL